MKGIYFSLRAAGGIADAFLHYKMAESPIVMGTLPVNVLAIIVAGSFILGVFSISSSVWNFGLSFFISGGNRLLRITHYHVVVCVRDKQLAGRK